MKIHTFNDLLTHELQDLYSAEQQIIEALPKLAEKATDKTLKEAYKMHLKETKVQLKRLEEIRDHLDIDIEGETCDGMKGLIKEGEKLFKEESSELLDQLLIAASQRVEHYEIAAYGCAITFAKLCKCKPAEKLLKETFAEEVKTDKNLTKIALSEQEDLK